MKCAHSRCMCGTVDGGFCSEACATAAYRSEADDHCGCSHVGCERTAATA